MTDATTYEIDTCSDNPRRFKRTYQTAQEVADYARAHGGALPAFVCRLSDAKWDALAATLRELDLIEWARRRVA